MDAIFRTVVALPWSSIVSKNIEELTVEAIDRALKEQEHPADEQCWFLDTHGALMRRYSGSTFVRLREADRDALIVVRSYQRNPTNPT